MLNMLWLAAVSPQVALSEEPVPYAVAAEPWEQGLGNHRARVRVAADAPAVWAHVPWRRRDRDPERKRIIVAGPDQQRITDAVAVRLDRIAGDIVFRPTSGPGEYCIYYLPFVVQDGYGWYGGDYLPPDDTADAQWRADNGLSAEQLAAEAWRNLPRAEVTAIDARTEFSRLDPMEVVATEAEVAEIVAAYPDDRYLVFAEDREHPVWMNDDLPLRWVQRGPASVLEGAAERDEFYVFQIGLFAARQGLEHLAVDFTDLRHEGGEAIAADRLRCVTLGGTDWTGEALTKDVSVAQGAVGALWCGIAVPPDAAPGLYTGRATVRPANAPAREVELRLTVLDQMADNHGYNDLRRQARLAWLDSTIAQDEQVTAPYTPLEVDGSTVRCLGRELTFGPGGLPDRIRSGGHDILAQPMNLAVHTAGGRVAWRQDEAQTGHRSEGAVEWESSAAAPGVSLSTRARMEYDGWVHYTLTVRADEDLDAQDMALELPLRREVAKYLMGIGHDGGFRPKEWSWKWGGQLYYDSFWMGDVPAGIQCELRGTSYSGPMVNLYWSLGQLQPPATWNNDGRGGCTVAEADDDVVLARAYTGPRQLTAGEELTFEFALLITPVRPLDTKRHFSERYFHAYEPVEQVAGYGANVVNIHHATEINPYINYPFLKAKELGEYVQAAHDRGMKVKIYYTLREFTNHVVEMPALRSLGHEVLAPGPGGNYPWLREHLGSDYAPSWYSPIFPDREDCASVVNSGASRWYNYYLEGLQWLVRYVGIDGLYVDDVSYDRRIMRRVRKILDRNREGCLVDLHSNTGFSRNPAIQYMEFFPFIDRLWFGESFDYDRSPDYWLTEICGIPYGLMGDMLQNGGNPWRGMIYGMTGRMPWSGQPGPMWKAWDDFGIAEARMVGYWEPDCPVHTDNPDVLATAYVRDGKAMVAVASWAKKPVRARLEVDWQALGLDPAKAHFYAPAIADYQDEMLFAIDDAIVVMPGRGWVLVADESPREGAPRWTGDVRDTARYTRALAWEEDFAGNEMPEGWTAQVTERPTGHMSISDGQLRIHCEAHRSAFIDRALSEGTTIVEALVSPGTDRGESWGVGLGLAWPDRFLRINVRATEKRVGVDTGQDQWLYPSFVEPGQPVHLRIRLDADRVFLELSADGELWFAVRTLPREAYPGMPTSVLVGKMSGTGKNEDAGLESPEGDCQVDHVRAYTDRAG